MQLIVRLDTCQVEMGENINSNSLTTKLQMVQEQYAGRLHRVHDKKAEVVIYDYVDIEEPMLASMYKKDGRVISGSVPQRVNIAIDFLTL